MVREFQRGANLLLLLYVIMDTPILPCHVSDSNSILGAVQVLRNQFWVFFRPPSPYVINCNHLEGPPPLKECNTVIILRDPPS